MTDCARPIRGLIFDFDGTILDTELPAFRAWQEIYEEHGCTLALTAWAAALGGSGKEFDPCAHLESLVGRQLDRETLRARRQIRKLELLAAEVVLPGVVEYIEGARLMGLRLAVASSSPRDWVEEHLRRFGLLEAFDCVSCAEDVERVKPDPALYLRTLENLGLRPDEAIVVEDSPNGIAAARAAGIFCVAVPNVLTRGLATDHADLHLTSLAELSLESLVEQVQMAVRV
jgi:HAD superfamily hydrolase (TIGR01509 family)